MRNFAKYAAEGQKKINENSKYDMQTSDYLFIKGKVDSGELTLFEAVEMVFNAGVEAGSRIEKKKAAEKMDAAITGMTAAQMKMTTAVIKAERTRS